MSQPDFESIKQSNVYGGEFWSARDLEPLLGYSSWRNFELAITRAKTSCEQASQSVSDHFVDAIKVIKAGKGAQQKLSDYSLSRFACKGAE